MENIKIEDFTIEYYEDAYTLWKSIKGLGLSTADSHENIKKFLEKNPGTSFVALDKNKLVGTILAGHDGRRAYIYHFAVKEELRIRGIGKLMLKRALEELKKTGMEKCHIFVFKDNKAGKRIWEKLGFIKRDDLDVMSFDLIEEEKEKPKVNNAEIS